MIAGFQNTLPLVLSGPVDWFGYMYPEFKKSVCHHCDADVMFCQPGQNTPINRK